jgi:hypothetical protein
MLSVCQKAGDNCCLGYEKSHVGINATRTTVMLEVYCETLKNTLWGWLFRKESVDY